MPYEYSTYRAPHPLKLQDQRIKQTRALFTAAILMAGS